MDPFVYDFCTFGLFFRLYMIFALFYEGSSGHLIVDRYQTYVYKKCLFTVLMYLNCAQSCRFLNVSRVANKCLQPEDHF